ncbi:hypothetical protein ACFE04_009411 [Oxalis oulophora]
MGRGVSCGGGSSSLGYLFGDGGENPKQKSPTNRPAETPAVAPSQPPTAAANPSVPAGGHGNVTNNYYRTDGQNCGNFITDRPSTKVHAAPGGGSSLGYLFGDNKGN